MELVWRLHLNNLKAHLNWRSFWILFLLLSQLLWLQACGNKNQAQESCNFVQNSEGQRVSWGAGSMVSFYVDPSVPTQFYPAIQAAAASWNQVIGHQQLAVVGWQAKAGTPVEDGINVIYWLNDWDPNQVNEQARTTIHWSANRLVEADVLINAKNFVFSAGAPLPGQVDLQSLLLHEFGHALGLKHVDAVSSVMQKTLAYDFERRQLQALDLASVKCEY